MDSGQTVRHSRRAKGFRSQGWWGTQTIGTTFLELSARNPERTALIEGERRLTYGEMRDRVVRTAWGLLRAGIHPGDVISYQLPNWIEAAIVFHATHLVGAIVNPLLPIYRSRELRGILREAKPRALIIPGTSRGIDYRGLIAEMPSLQHVWVVRGEKVSSMESFQELIDSSTEENPSSLPGLHADPDGVSLLMYTSGTTAEPKGVLHTHNTLLYEIHSLERVHGLGPRDTVLMPSSVGHISGVLHAVLGSFVLGTRAVFMDQWNPSLALELIEQEKITYMVGPPVFLQGITYHERLTAFDLASFRLFSCGGAGVAPQLIRDSCERLRCIAKRVYGSTEFPTATTTSAEDSLDKRAETDGRLIWPAEVRIVDETGRPVPAGKEGEITLRGPECCVGYKNPTLNIASFDEEGWFFTGDLGVVDSQGYLRVTGRKKDIIIRKGEKISAGEVEGLLALHPKVAEIAIVALPDPITGEKACACVHPRPGAQITLEELVAFLKEKGLAAQKFPEQLEIVTDLPRNAFGKIQKQRLRDAVMRKT